MKSFKVIILLSILISFGCDRVEKLNEFYRIDVIKQIIKDEKITNLDNEFSKIDPNDSTLYYITYFPNDVQKYNHSSSVIAFNKLFDKEDLIEFKKQIDSFDTTLRLSRLIKDEKVNLFSISDSSRKNGIECCISYPMLNQKKNAVIVYLSYYGGMMIGGKMVLLYAKKSGKWIRLSTIWDYII
jgi:hypothetical protein